MRIIVLIICVLSVIQSRAQLLFRVNADSVFTYVFNGGDEFDKIDFEKKWINGIGGRRVLMDQSVAFSPENVRINDGKAEFIARKCDTIYQLYDYEIDSAWLKKSNTVLDEHRYKVQYKAGAIRSRTKWFYGYYEINFKVEEGKGVWPAFWFYCGYKNEEIDVMELKNENTSQIHVDTHCPYGCDRGYRGRIGIPANWGGWAKIEGSLSKGYNIIGLEWRPGYLNWYINGKHLAHFRGSFTHAGYIFINTSVARTGGAFSPGPDETTVWPNIYSVDWLRCWERSSASILNDTIDGGEVLVVHPSTLEMNIDTNQCIPFKNRGVSFSSKKRDSHLGLIRIQLSVNGQLNIFNEQAEKGNFVSMTVHDEQGNLVATINDPGRAVLPLKSGIHAYCLTITTRNGKFKKWIATDTKRPF